MRVKPTMKSSNEWKLPTNVRPTGYRLTLEPDLDTFIFMGSETVDVELAEPTSAIILNSAEELGEGNLAQTTGDEEGEW